MIPPLETKKITLKGDDNMLHLHTIEYDTYHGDAIGMYIDPRSGKIGEPITIFKQDVLYFTNKKIHLRDGKDIEVWETHDEILKQWEGSHVL
jgi:hypothetical protein